jgi:ribosome biogenesis GTPase A
MIGKQYKAHKDNVIDLFGEYKTTRGNLNDGVDINFLESRIDSLKKGKFTLAVAGEVKAGKSTFINALLGAEILPSDVLQASSAIVEIFKSENTFLKVNLHI